MEKAQEYLTPKEKRELVYTVIGDILYLYTWYEEELLQEYGFVKSDDEITDTIPQINAGKGYPFNKHTTYRRNVSNTINAALFYSQDNHLSEFAMVMPCYDYHFSYAARLRIYFDFNYEPIIHLGTYESIQHACEDNLDNAIELFAWDLERFSTCKNFYMNTLFNFLIKLSKS